MAIGNPGVSKNTGSKNPNARYTDEQRATVTTMRFAGKTWLEIEAATGVKPRAAFEMAKAAGVPAQSKARTPAEVTDEQRVECQKRSGHGLSVLRIAHQLGMTEHMVRRALGRAT